MKRRRVRPAFRRQRRIQQPRRARRLTVRAATALGVELKFYDKALVGGVVTAPTDATGGEHDPSATVLLNTVVQGDDGSNRDGRQIVMKHISLRGNISTAIQLDQTALDQAPMIFVALVLDTQTNGATIASENVFTNPGANSLLAAQPFHNLKFSKRFRVLKALTFALPMAIAAHDATNIEVAGTIIPWTMFVDLKDIVVNYSAASETVVNITDNSLHVIAYATSTGTTPLINYNSRLRFVG